MNVCRSQRTKDFSQGSVVEGQIYLSQNSSTEHSGPHPAPWGFQNPQERSNSTSNQQTVDKNHHFRNKKEKPSEQNFTDQNTLDLEDPLLTCTCRAQEHQHTCWILHEQNKTKKKKNHIKSKNIRTNQIRGCKYVLDWTRLRT